LFCDYLHGLFLDVVEVRNFHFCRIFEYVNCILSVISGCRSKLINDCCLLLFAGPAVSFSRFFCQFFFVFISNPIFQPSSGFYFGLDFYLIHHFFFG
ncbi:MAG: hypothetical protein MR353_06530, partial [Spirochaetia bacterium]|nr:hypothetical protein [Spirochaetia bacterium]